MSLVENRRAVAGDNQATAAAQRVTEYLERDYASFVGEVDAVLEKARGAPREVGSDEDALALGSIVKEAREIDKRAETYRETEKAPHRLSADACDSFFFSLRDKLGRRNPRDMKQKPGLIDILQARIGDFLERKRIEEENRRRAEEARLRREAEEKAAAEKAARREAEEARLAAERARNPERITEKSALADQLEEKALTATVEAESAAAQAQEAHIATLAKPAEMARTRGEGVLLTQAQEGYVALLDRTAITAEAWLALAPYFTNAEIEKAGRAYGKATNHSKQLPGFEIGFRRKGVTR